MESIFRNIDSLEESHTSITRLIEQLDRDSRQNDHSEVGVLISGMEEKLGQFSDNHFELQREIEELLENSRRGALSHEKLTEMVNAEQVRTSYLSSIVNSLKSQIEGLFNKLVAVTDEDSETATEPGQIVEQVSDNVNLLWKSVDSLSKLIGSPTKKLEYNIQKIDSEVIVHLNKTLHVHDKGGNNSSQAEGGGNFPEKVENKLKAVRTKKQAKGAAPSGNTNLTPIQESSGKETAQYRKYGSNHAPPPENNSPMKPDADSSNNNDLSPNKEAQYSARKASQGQVSPLQLKTIKKPLPPEESKIHVEVNRTETYQTAEEIAAMKKKAAAEKAAALAAATNAAQQNDQAYLQQPPIESQREPPSSTVMKDQENPVTNAKLMTDEVTPAPSQPTTARKEGGAGREKGSSKGRKGSRGNENHVVSTSSTVGNVDGTMQEKDASDTKSRKSSTVNSSTTTGTTKASKKGDSKPSTAASRNDGSGDGRLTSRNLDDEGSVSSVVSTAREDGFPRDRKTLIRLLEEKDRKLKDQEKNFDTELKKRVKEYLKNHGIGFGALPPTGTSDHGVELNDSITVDPSSTSIGNKSDPHDSIPVVGTVSTASALDEALKKEIEQFSDPDPQLLQFFEDQKVTNTTRPSTENSLSRPQSSKGEGKSPIPISIDTPVVLTSGPSSPVSPGKQQNTSNAGMMTTGKNSRVTSHNPSRVPSRENGKHPRYLLQNDGTAGAGTGSGAISRQPSWKLSRNPSFHDELQELRQRIRQYHHDQYHSHGDSDDPNFDPQQVNRLEDILTTIYSNLKTAHGGVTIPEDWNLIRFSTPPTKYRKEEKMTSTEDLEEWIHKRLYELPIYDNQENILITRTYHLGTEPLTFEQQLQESPNPLYLLYQAFANYLSPLQRDRLFFASLLSVTKQHTIQNTSISGKITSTTNTTTTTGINNPEKINIAEPTLELLVAQRNRKPILAAAHQFLRVTKQLYQESQQLLPYMNAIETLVNDAVQIIKTVSRPPRSNGESTEQYLPSLDYLRHSLADLYRLFGLLEGQELMINLRFFELRGFFEQIQSIHVKELEILIQESKDIGEAYQLFTEMQGCLLEVQRRLAASKDRAKRYQLLEFFLEQQQQQQQQLLSLQQSLQQSLSPNPTATTILPAVSSRPGTGSKTPINTATVTRKRRMSSTGEFFNDSAPSTASHSMPTSPNPSQRRLLPPTEEILETNNMNNDPQSRLIKRLQDHLQSAQEEIEDLEMEMISLLKDKDQTPAAILFFSILQDPTIIENLQQLLIQFKSIKHFLDYSENIDYLTLRKRLQVCLVLMPSIEKLIHKYGQLFQQWSYYRLNWFAERKVRGSASDGMNACPLCYHDLSEKEGIVDPLVAGVTRTTHGKGKKEKKHEVVGKGQSLRGGKKALQPLNGLSVGNVVNTTTSVSMTSQSMPLLGFPSIMTGKGGSTSQTISKLPSHSQSSK